MASILSGLGDPGQAVERERARLEAERREKAAAGGRSGLLRRPQRRGGAPDAGRPPADQKDPPAPAAPTPQIAGRSLTGEYAKKKNESNFPWSEDVGRRERLPYN